MQDLQLLYNCTPKKYCVSMEFFLYQVDVTGLLYSNHAASYLCVAYANIMRTLWLNIRVGLQHVNCKHDRNESFCPQTIMYSRLESITYILL